MTIWKVKGRTLVFPDINLLVYAYNSSSPNHSEAKLWLESLLNEGVPVGLTWVVVLGFIRIMTDNRIMVRPMNPQRAVGHVQKWLESPGVSIVEPGPDHLKIMAQLIQQTTVAGRLTTDIHIAALTLEHHGEVHSNDRDFDRFTGLRRHNPLSLSKKPGRKTSGLKSNL